MPLVKNLVFFNLQSFRCFFEVNDPRRRTERRLFVRVVFKNQILIRVFVNFNW
jgi:hypothetical protein